jgi:hypothetical protein
MGTAIYETYYRRYSLTGSPLSAHFSTELGLDPVIVYTYKPYGYFLCNPFLTELGRDPVTGNPVIEYLLYSKDHRRAGRTGRRVFKGIGPAAEHHQPLHIVAKTLHQEVEEVPGVALKKVDEGDELGQKPVQLRNPPDARTDSRYDGERCQGSHRPDDGRFHTI